MPAYEGITRDGAFTQVEVRASYWNENATEGMRLGFAALAVLRFMDRGSNMHGIYSLAGQRAFVAAEVANVKDAEP